MVMSKWPWSLTTSLTMSLPLRRTIAPPWATWDTQDPLELRADGYPAALPPGKIAHKLAVRNVQLHSMPGRYVALYDGEGILDFGFDAKVGWTELPAECISQHVNYAGPWRVATFETSSLPSCRQTRDVWQGFIERLTKCASTDSAELGYAVGNLTTWMHTWVECYVKLQELSHLAHRLKQWMWLHTAGHKCCQGARGV